jgi:hypothetical protein
MSQSFRFVKRGVAGRVRQNFNTTAIRSRDSVVHITAAEIKPQDHFDGEGGGVEFILNVDFPSPIDVAITITVEDNFPVEIQGL